MNAVRLLLPLAWRNLWRNPRRTLITLVVVVVGMWSILSFIVMLKAFGLSAREASLRLLTGQGQIHATGYLDDPDITRRMAAPAGALLSVLDGPNVTVWAPRLRVPAILQSEYRTLAVGLVAVLPERERTISDLPAEIAKGRYLQSSTDAAIVLGKHMIERLKTRVGKRVILMAQAADGHLAQQGFTVAGAFGGAQPPQDQFAFVGLKTAQTMLGAGDTLSEISFDVTSDESLSATVTALQKAAPGLDIQPWITFSPIAFALQQLTDTYIFIWLLIMFVLMAIGIINTQLMAVFERTREFGLLQAIGMRPRLILVQVTLESTLLIGIGVLLGAGLAILTVEPLKSGVDLGALAPGVEHFGVGGILYPKIEARDVVTFSLVVWILGIVTALWPARRAARIGPIEALANA